MAAIDMRRIFSTPRVRRVLLSLLAIDTTLIAMDLVRGLLRAYTDYQGFFSAQSRRLDVEFGAFETVGYLKLIAASVVLVALYRGLRRPTDLLWAGVLMLMVIDDAFALHEQIGVVALGRDAPVWSDAVTLVPAASVAIGGMVYAHLRTTGAARVRSLALLALFAALVLFAIPVDVAHAALPTPSVIEVVGRMFEEGGEALVLTLVLCRVLVDRWGSPDRAPFANTVQRGRLS